MLALSTMRRAPQNRHRISPPLAMVIFFMLLVALIPNVPRLETAPRAQPELIALAEQQPDATIGVIVQKDATSTNVEQQVADLGGTVTMDLHIINAFAAQLTASASISLARMTGVRWISLDTPSITSISLSG